MEQDHEQGNPFRKRATPFAIWGVKCWGTCGFHATRWALWGVTRLPLSFLLTACCWWFLSWHLIDWNFCPSRGLRGWKSGEGLRGKLLRELTFAGCGIYFIEAFCKLSTKYWQNICILKWLIMGQLLAGWGSICIKYSHVRCRLLTIQSQLITIV